MTARKKGIDVSHWQAPGAAVIREAGAVFGWIKVSQGATGRDVRAAAHHKVFGELGIERGPYHFADTRWSAEANARNLVTAMGGLAWELRPVIDLEQNRGGLNPHDLAVWILACAAEVERLCGVKPIVYTYAAMWNASVEPLDAFKALLLWVARYPTAYAHGEIPADDVWSSPAHPWLRAVVWQYSTVGNLDRNLVSVVDFAVIHSQRGQQPPPPPPTPGGLHMDADVSARFVHLEQQIQTLLDTTAKKAAALRSKKDGKVWIVSDEGRWHVPDMETLNVLIFVGQVHGLGTDGKVAEVDESVLDGIPINDAPK